MKAIIVLLSLALLIITARKHSFQISHYLKNPADVFRLGQKRLLVAGQYLNLGEFSLGPVKRYWSARYNIPFLNRFYETGEKLSYRLQNSVKREAYAACVHKLGETEGDMLRKDFSLPVCPDNSLAGSVFIPDRDHQYDFVLFNPVYGAEGSLTAGYIRWGSQTIRIEGVENKLPDQKAYTFTRDEKAIGAVQVYNIRKLWLARDLSDELRLVLAAVSTGLMIREEAT